MELKLIFCISAFQFCFIHARNIKVEDVGHFWHITDMHWDPTYMEGDTNGALSCNELAGKPGTWGKWGDFLCDSPWSLINSSVMAMKKIHPNPDFVIWTGDDTPHIWDDDILHMQAVKTIISNLTEILEDVWGDTPIFSALGNHDWHPKNQLPPRNDPLYDVIAEEWQTWLDSPTAQETFRKGGYYEGFFNNNSIIVLNTNLYYESNQITKDMPDPANQFQWLDDKLRSVKERGSKAMLVAHVPPGKFEKHPDTHWFYPFYNDMFLFILHKYNDTIGSIHMGHHHTDSFRLVRDEKNGVIGSILLAPAVAPWETTLPGVMGGKGNNPSIRLIQFDRTNMAVLDVHQYYLNLVKANQEGNDDWELAYKATDYYGLEDFGHKALGYLTERLYEDDALFDKYYKANGVFYDPDEEWSSEAQTVHICAIANINYNDYHQCLDNHSGSKGISNNPSLIIAIISVVLWF